MQGWRAETVASWSELMSNEEISIFGYLCSKTSDISDLEAQRGDTRFLYTRILR